MYSIKYGQVGKKTAKCVICATTKNELRHSMYRDCIFNETVSANTMKSIRRFEQNIYSIEINKLSLSTFDDKRFVLDNKCDTLAHGQYSIYCINV